MTAELLAQALAREGQAVPVEISAALRAEGPTDVALAQLEERCRSQRVAAVGHEPMLSELLRRLLPEAAVATALPQGKLDKGAIAALRLGKGEAQTRLRALWGMKERARGQQRAPEGETAKAAQEGERVEPEGRAEEKEASDAAL